MFSDASRILGLIARNAGSNSKPTPEITTPCAALLLGGERFKTDFWAFSMPRPLIRAKAIQATQKQLRAQALGNITSLLALEMNEADGHLALPSDKDELIDRVMDHMVLNGKSKEELLDAIALKCAKYLRGKSAMEAVHESRKAEGFPSPLTLPEESEGVRHDSPER